MDENKNMNDLLDLGSDPVGEDFNPFDDEDVLEDSVTDNTPTDTTAPQEVETEATAQDDTITEVPAVSDNKPKPATATDNKAAAPKEADTPQQDNTEKPPVFEYAGATENIDDASKTFDELRIEKSADFPELEDGKRVSWTMEYGKITKTVADPKGVSIGKMKSDIETSKEFEDSLKKRGADKNPTCKVKPRVTAQSKGQAPTYKGVFPNAEEAETAGKVISIIPGRDGKVYEIRNTEMGRFTTPIVGCELLSEVRAGFVPALPRIPAELMMQIVSFFRSYMSDRFEKEALVNVYWDKVNPGFFIDVPNQTVTKASVVGQVNEDYAHDRYVHYMDIHSHNSMEAYFSAVDNSDEKATRLYSVIGKLDEYFPDIKTRISNGGKFHDIDPAEVFELVSLPFPNHWKEKISFQSSNRPSSEAHRTFVKAGGDYALCA